MGSVPDLFPITFVDINEDLGAADRQDTKRAHKRDRGTLCWLQWVFFLMCGHILHS